MLDHYCIQTPPSCFIAMRSRGLGTTILVISRRHWDPSDQTFITYLVNS